ncbi:MAG: DUF4974 domain-containing protein [Candidatus Pseudobacter hemicellulosilyticus]|uniref:DUF4974 domain-containing protein n=1 Tax=Candidatus Pseudobacter hemicellulosilyticus TaxID=3121375 RepID=A0AAJ5WVQ3_9BACT|nr:MAG: DUF4974 domain-containing protein [Pseudobacter sp.]
MQDIIGRAAPLLIKDVCGTITSAEKAELVQLLGQELVDSLREEFTDVDRLQVALQAYAELERSSEARLSLHLSRIFPAAAHATILQEPVRRPRKMFRLLYAMAAASAILVVFLVIRFMNGSPSEAPVVKADSVRFKNDVAPGIEGAVLTLADGRQVSLDSAANGVVATQSGAEAVLKDGQLAYNLKGAGSGAVQYNTMTTPKGRQFSLLLPDGTRVWLNAASSIRYPTRFSGVERKVEVTGEAFFSVAQNVRSPFRVVVNNEAEVEVLGTSFNVMAYADERMVNTTLLEGAVRIRKTGGQEADSRNSVLLRPGQQAQVPMGLQLQSGIKVIPAPEGVTAWVDGELSFRRSSIQDVMRVLSRWYDIDVVYEPGKLNYSFMARISNKENLSEVLKMLELTGYVEFSIDGRTVTVRPK